MYSARTYSLSLFFGGERRRRRHRCHMCTSMYTNKIHMHIHTYIHIYGSVPLSLLFCRQLDNNRPLAPPPRCFLFKYIHFVFVRIQIEFYSIFYLWVLCNNIIYVCQCGYTFVQFHYVEGGTYLYTYTFQLKYDFKIKLQEHSLFTRCCF